MNNLQKLLRNIGMLRVWIERCCFYLHRQDYSKGINVIRYGIISTCSSVYTLMEEILKNDDYMKLDINEMQKTLTNLLNELCEIQAKGDYIQYADFLEYELRTWTISCVKEFYDNGIYCMEECYELNLKFFNDSLIQDSMENEYKLAWKELFDNGRTLDLVGDEYTVFDNEISLCSLNINNVFYTSRYNPDIIGLRVADEYIRYAKDTKDGLKKIAILGLDMGYMESYLVKYNEVESIVIFEPNMDIITISLHYTYMYTIIASKKTIIIHDPDLTKFSAYIKNPNVSCFINQPSIPLIQPAELRHKVEDFNIQLSSVRNQGGLLKSNFYNNSKLGDMEVSGLRTAFANKDVIFIAGGPSLDSDIDNLDMFVNNKEYEDGRGTYIIMAAGTVVKKLYAHNIIPDYIVMTDPQQNMITQLEGLDTTKSKLIYLSTLYYKVPKYYQGERYIVYQNEFDMSEEKVKLIKAADAAATPILVNTGGSVSTTAIDLCIQLGCSRFIALGLDLGFYDNKTHASETDSVHEISNTTDAASMRRVKSVDGKTILTSKNLDIYRGWIERRLAEVKDTEFVNCSKGAYIEGMRCSEFAKEIGLSQ